jgi:IclR family transcriptional regulator, pca regulon regulatory protein
MSPAVRGAVLGKKVTKKRRVATNQSVGKALDVLRAFGGARRVLNLAEIAAAAGVTKSSAQRFTTTLRTLGLLARDDLGRGWALTPRVLTLGHAYLAGHALLERATSVLLELNVATGESVSLSERDGTQMIYMARLPGHHPFFIHMPIGRMLPMFCTAAGRAYMSRLPDEEVREILERSTLTPLTPMTITDPRRILEKVAAARELGYATAEQECYRGDLTIGAPILGSTGRPVAALNISGPTSRWTMTELVKRFAPLVIQTARAASSGVADRAVGR